MLGEAAASRDSGLLGRPTGGLERVVENIDADDARCPMLSHLEGLATGATAEIGHRPSGELRPDARTEEHLELAPAQVGTAVTISLALRPLPETPQEAIGQRAADDSGAHHVSLVLIGWPSTRKMSRPSSSARPQSVPSAIRGDTTGGEAERVSVGNSSVTTRIGRT